MGNYLNSCMWNMGRFGAIFALDYLEVPLGGRDVILRSLKSLCRQNKVTFILLLENIIYIRFYDQKEAFI